MPKKNNNFGKWEKIDSSFIDKFKYDPDNKILRIKFLNGKEYDYESVSSYLIDKFIESKSKGSFFHKKIKNKTKKHPFKKVATKLSRSYFLGRVLSKQTLLEKWNKNE